MDSREGVAMQPVVTSELALDCTGPATTCKGATWLVTYSALTTTHVEAPTCCPQCGPKRVRTATNTVVTRPRQYRPADQADQLVLNHMGYTRTFALAVLDKYAEAVHYHKAGYTLNIEELIIKAELDTPKYPFAHAYTPLHVTCNDCGSVFDMLRGTPVAQQTPPVYCVWCASTNITVNQQSTSEVSWQVLAAKYDLPVAIVQKFYDHWSARNTHKHFSDYMLAHADDVELVKLSLELTTGSK